MSCDAPRRQAVTATTRWVGHATVAAGLPFLRAKRTSQLGARTSGFDPEADIGLFQNASLSCYNASSLSLGGSMRRRTFIEIVGGAAVTWPLAARAQPSGKVYRIGFLGVTSQAEYARFVDPLRVGLRQLGYEEGKHIV